MHANVYSIGSGVDEAENDYCYLKGNSIYVL